MLTTVLAGKSGHHRFFRKGGASRGASSGLRRLLAAGLILALLGSSAGPAYALPVFDGIAEDPDGNPYGDADVVQHGSTMTITQNTDRVIINWSSFSIDHDEIVEFIQGGPHRVALNRVTGNELSEIFGQLKSDGRLFLVNPAGIVFGEGAQVNVGALVASVLDIDNAAFWGGADAYTFTRGGGGGESPYDIHVEPGATLSAGDREDGGFIVLLGPKIMNEGTIIGQLGTVALGAGDQVTVELLGGGTVELEIQQRSDDARVVQTDTGQLLAEGGDVLILLDTVSSAVLLKGIVEATGIDNEGGRIVLRGNDIAVPGELEASGDVDVAGGQLRLDGTVESTGGGTVALTATDTSSSAIDLAGWVKARGGTVIIDAAGGVVQETGGGITAGSLLLRGTPTDGSEVVFDLDGAANAVGTLASAGTIRSITFRQADSLTIGTVNGTAGLTAADLVDVAVTGTGSKLTVSQAVAGGSVTLAGQGGIQLNAGVTATDGGQVKLSSGASVNQTADSGITAGTLVLEGETGLFNLNSWRKNAVSRLLSQGTIGLVNYSQERSLTVDGITATRHVHVQVLGNEAGDVLAVAGDVSSGQVTLLGWSGIDLQANLTATGDEGITLRSWGTVAGENVSIEAPVLKLEGYGAVYTLLNDGSVQNLTTISDLASLTYQQSGALTVGEVRATGAVEIRASGTESELTVSGPVSASNVTLQGLGGIALNAAVTATAGGGSVELISAGEVTQSTAAAITADGLLLTGLGTGTFSLSGDDNAVGTLAIRDAGAGTFEQSGHLAIGTVRDADGISATGDVQVILTGARLTVERDVAAGGNVTLTAAEIIADGDRTIAAGTAGQLALSQLRATAASTLTLQAGSGGIQLSGGAKVSGGTLVLRSDGSVTQGDAIVAGALRLEGSGAFVLTGPGNDVHTLSGANLGSVAYKQAGALSVDGLEATGAVSVEVDGAGEDTLTVSGAVSGDNVTLKSGAGGIALEAAVTALDILTLESPGAVAQGEDGAVRADRLVLLGGGRFRLTSLDNNVKVLAGRTGSVRYEQSGSMAIGSARGVDGLAAAETLWVIVHGDEADLTLAESVSAGGENDYVLVLAAGNRFLNEAGPDAITIDADNGGMYLVFSKDHKTSDLGEMASPGNLFASDYARVGVEQAVADIKRGYGLTLGSRFVYANAPTIIIAIEDKERLYGDGNPEFTFIREGLVSGDRWEDVLAEGTLTTAADATSPVGTYAITADGFEALLGYRLDIIGGTLTITPRPITVTADSYSKMQGEPDPELTYRITAGSLVRGDQLQGRLTREPGERPGEYAILQGTLGHRNYEIRFVPGTLTITLRPDARGAIPPADPFPEAPAAPAGGAGGGAAGSTCNGGVGGGAAGALDDTRADLPMGVECDLPDDAQTGTSGTGQGMPYDGGAARR